MQQWGFVRTCFCCSLVVPCSFLRRDQALLSGSVVGRQVRRTLVQCKRSFPAHSLPRQIPVNFHSPRPIHLVLAICVLRSQKERLSIGSIHPPLDTVSSLSVLSHSLTFSPGVVVQRAHESHGERERSGRCHRAVVMIPRYPGSWSSSCHASHFSVRCGDPSPEPCGCLLSGCWVWNFGC